MGVTAGAESRFELRLTPDPWLQPALRRCRETQRDCLDRIVKDRYYPMDNVYQYRLSGWKKRGQGENGLLRRLATRGATRIRSDERSSLHSKFWAFRSLSKRSNTSQWESWFFQLLKSGMKYSRISRTEWSVFHFFHGLHRGLHSYAALRLGACFGESPLPRPRQRTGVSALHDLRRVVLQKKKRPSDRLTPQG